MGVRVRSACLGSGNKPHEWGRFEANGSGVSYGQEEALFVHVTPHRADVFLEALTFFFETVKLADCHSDGALVILVDFFPAPTAPLRCLYTQFDSDHLRESMYIPQ
jgi:hypothetical protein